MKRAKRYAEGTKVPVEKSRAEIEMLLRKHGATGFVSGWDETSNTAMLMFRIGDRMIKIRVSLPDPTGSEFRVANKDRQAQLLEAEQRRRWRAQLLIIKAKLEMISTGETTVEREFLADIMLPDGSTFGQWAAPQLAESYTTGGMPRMLGSGE